MIVSTPQTPQTRTQVYTFSGDSWETLFGVKNANVSLLALHSPPILDGEPPKAFEVGAGIFNFLISIVFGDSTWFFFHPRCITFAASASSRSAQRSTSTRAEADLLVADAKWSAQRMPRKSWSTGRTVSQGEETQPSITITQPSWSPPSSSSTST